MSSVYETDLLDKVEYNELSHDKVKPFLEFILATEITPVDLARFFPPSDLATFVGQATSRLITAYNLDMKNEMPVKRTIIAIATLYQNVPLPTDFSPDSITHIHPSELWERLEFAILYIAIAKVQAASA